MSPMPNERAAARLGWTLLLLGVGGFFAWAMWAPLDQGVAVAGHLTVVGQRQTVQHASGGVVESILVSDGQPVEAGQPLMRLQQPILHSQVRNLRHQWQAAEAQMARLSAEKNGETPRFPASLDPAVQVLQQQLFERRASSLLSERQALKASLLGSQSQLKSVQAALSGQQQQQRSLQGQVNSLQSLASEGFVSQHRALESGRQLTQMGVAIDESHGRIGLLRRQIEEQQVRYRQLEETFRRDATSQVADTRQQAEDLRHRLAVAERELAASTLVAPVAGRVSGLRISTLGEVIKPGQVLLDIVPRDKPLQVEARLPVDTVDKVRIGLPVELLFPAFNQSTTPRVPGRATLIGADRQQDERTGEPYYLLRAEVIGQSQLAGLTLQPGMPVQAFIRTGERSLLNYLLKPLRDRSRLALVEE